MVFGGLLLVKPSFSREKDGFSKDGCSKQSFSREKDGFEPKNHLFLEKTKKTKKNQKKQKNHLFQNYGAGAFKRWFFWFSREKDGFFGSKPSFSREKDVEPKNHLFLEKTKKTIFWRPQPHSFGKDGFFGFFGFFGFLDYFGLLVFVSFLFCCFLP